MTVQSGAKFKLHAGGKRGRISVADDNGFVEFPCARIDGTIKFNPFVCPPSNKILRNAESAEKKGIFPLALERKRWNIRTFG